MSDIMISDEIHDLLIEMINDVEEDMETYEVKKKALRKKTNFLYPVKSYRTSELLKYYINLGDLQLLIKYHK